MTLTRESRVIDCDSSRVESFCEKCDSSRVTIFLNVTRVESKSPQIVTRVESLTRVTLPLILSIELWWTAFQNYQFTWIFFGNRSHAYKVWAPDCKDILKDRNCFM